MKTKKILVAQAFALVPFLIMACGIAAPAPTAAPTVIPPTNTPEPTQTATPLPTDTPEPTVTPDVAATQQAEEFQNILASFQEKGYIGTTVGESTHIRDFKDEFNQMYFYYKWWYQDEVKGEYSDFVFSAHLEWNSYSSTPDVNGCGIGFGIKENDDHYALILDRTHLLLVRGKGSRVTLMGTSGGEKFPAIPIPAKADLIVAVAADKIAASVNGKVTTYILASDQNAQGKVAFTVLAGTNGGYGTRCTMTNIVFWTPK